MTFDLEAARKRRVNRNRTLGEDHLTHDKLLQQLDEAEGDLTACMEALEKAEGRAMRWAYMGEQRDELLAQVEAQQRRIEELRVALERLNIRGCG